MSTIPNPHRLIYGVLGGILAVCVAIQSGVIQLPPNLAGAQFYAIVLVVFLGFFLPHYGADASDPPPPPPPALHG